jgi:hypothetical protein
MFAEHTNINPKELGEYTIEQISYLIEGINKNNSNESETKQVKGLDAVKALQKLK